MKAFLLPITAILVLSMIACSEEAIDESRFGTLTGKVVAKGDNSPLANVKITSTPVSTTVFTDASGNFTIEGIQVGEYSVQAELPDFQTAFEAADILENKTVNVVFELDSVNVDNLVPLAPRLLFPEEGAESIPVATEFAWSSSANDDDEIWYTLELRNGETNEITTYDELRDTTLLVENLVIGKNYFWQVTADDGINEPIKSSLGGFATKGGEADRFVFVRKLGGNNVIFSASEPEENGEEIAEQDALQLTGSTTNSYRPKRSGNRLAFLRSVGGETHLFVQNIDGTGLQQVTSSVPVAGFRQEELEFAWYGSGAKLFYPNFNKLYSINLNGSGNELVYELADGEFISEIAVDANTGSVALKSNDANGYNARIAVVDLQTGSEQAVVIEGIPGALGGLDFSIDGTKILYTRDVAEAQNAEYRQLDSRIFEHDLIAGTATEVETDKAPGTNDLDPKYAPDDGAIIFMNTSNDGISPKNIYRTDADTSDQKTLLFEDASMPNWE